MKMTRNEDAVSPVIGVILMVAVTVILAAVIAAFVFGMSGNISKAHVVAATGQVDSTGNVAVTYQGGQDAAQVQSMNVTFDAGNTNVVKPLPITVGSSVSGIKGHTVVAATFKDGSTSVILDTTY
ncbi:type IV pilin [Methanosphaerula palustris]|uniref:Archaeal Type IV pilin N-terminal domain-containing protein n=1 Tax=Methanosphaerula palustris (strain ATCC BAA-1556 / DSM 19958 / E1-9c) TaxID=521011 RepID=B8GEJ4_METPE|nr:type IV pilin N-terminal domain-containing protein [Methanosphaerula palustris]ACL17695.1 Protein of unknown function DUF1628 [Methanosphaerula palustris E1-9c]